MKRIARKRLKEPLVRIWKKTCDVNRALLQEHYFISVEEMMTLCKIWQPWDVMEASLTFILCRNSTRSLYDSDVVYFEIHGRRYCKDYFMPNDEDEQTRLQMLNGVYFNVLGDRLTTVPLSDPQRILDIGTGTGE